MNYRYREEVVTIRPHCNWWRLQHVPNHNISYLDWGDVNNDKVVFCVHGLSRNSHDFDRLACSLSKNFRVISIDVPGRGKSDWFENGKNYNYYVYVHDCIKLIETLNIKPVSWIGTSMGGAIGMVIAAFKPNYIKSLILNDIGSRISKAQLRKVNQTVKDNIEFSNRSQAELFLKRKFSKTGIKNLDDLENTLKFYFKKQEDNSFTVHYDPKIITKNKIRENDNGYINTLSHAWKRTKCQVLLIHGDKSTILTKEIIEDMVKVRNFDLYTVKDVGHAPALVDPSEIQFIESWLLKNYIEG